MTFFFWLTPAAGVLEAFLLLLDIVAKDYLGIAIVSDCLIVWVIFAAVIMHLFSDWSHGY